MPRPSTTGIAIRSASAISAWNASGSRPTASVVIIGVFAERMSAATLSMSADGASTLEGGATGFMPAGGVQFSIMVSIGMQR